MNLLHSHSAIKAMLALSETVVKLHNK